MIDAQVGDFIPSIDTPMEYGVDAHDTSEDKVLEAMDNLVDDLMKCRTDVLRVFARARGVSASTKGQLVLKLLEKARDEGLSNKDLKMTKKVLGDLFDDTVRTSGVRSSWTNESLEASHVEAAVSRHVKFQSMLSIHQSVRANARMNSTVLKRLIRPFQEDFEKTANAAVGGVFRTYKSDLEHYLKTVDTHSVLTAFAAYLSAHISKAKSGSFLSTTHVIETLIQEGLVQPTVEEGDLTTLEQMMHLLDSVAEEAEARYEAMQKLPGIMWGQERVELMYRRITSAVENQKYWELDGVPEWMVQMASQFGSWEALVRNDISSLANAPSAVFNAIFLNVAAIKIMKLLNGDETDLKEIPSAYRSLVRHALCLHIEDDEAVADVIGSLVAFAHSDKTMKANAVNLGTNFFEAVLSQLQARIPDETSANTTERLGLLLQELCVIASWSERASGTVQLLQRLTEDLCFHLRFSQIYQRLPSQTRKTIRTKKGIHMIRTLEYFEKEFDIVPLSMKSVAFLNIILLYLCTRSHGSQSPLIERYTSCTNKEEFGILHLAGLQSVTLQSMKVALPPQLSYTSWLGTDEEKKSVYKVMDSRAVKGMTNDIMIVSQAPMMKALDAISKVPWRISKYMLFVQEAIVREGYGFGKIRPAFYPLNYCNFKDGAIHHTGLDRTVYNSLQNNSYQEQMDEDWHNLSDLRSTRIHFLQALRQARSLYQFSHLYFPNSLDFRGRMYPLPGRLNHTGSDPFRAMLEYAEAKPLGKEGLFWLKVHLANKMGQTKVSFLERAQYVDEHITDVVQSAEAPFTGDRWWQEGAEPLQALMACKELSDALKCSTGPEHFLSRLPVAVDGSYNGLQHYSAIGRDEYGAKLVNLVPSERPVDAYTGILQEMMKWIHLDAENDNEVALKCIGSGKGLDRNHLRRKTIKRPIMTQVYGVTAFGMTTMIGDELKSQNKAHGLWTQTDIDEMAQYIRNKLQESLGITFKETQECRKWLNKVSTMIWQCQPDELRSPFMWTTPLGLIVRQPYRAGKEAHLFTASGYSRVPGTTVEPASRKQLSALAPNIIHSLDATHLAMTAIEMQNLGLSMMAVHDSFWTYAADLPTLSRVLREQFVALYDNYDPLWDLKEQWEELFFNDLRRHAMKLPDPPQRGNLELHSVLNSQYFFS